MEVMAQGMTEPDKPEDKQTAAEQRDRGRATVDIDCEIKVGHTAWRKARITDLTPEGFRVHILELPPPGTPVSLRFANLQMLQAEVRWSKVSGAGCRFQTPLSDYVFDHIVATVGR